MAVSAVPAVDTFTFDELARPDRTWLKRVAANIRVHLRKLQSHRLSVGHMLCRARKRLGGRNGAFGRWISFELGLPRRQATRLMNVWRQFGDLPPHVVILFDPTALYTLSEPCVPAAVVDDFKKRAMAGNLVRGCEVDQKLAQLRDSPEGDESLIPKDPPAKHNADEVHAADNWFLLVHTIDGGVTLHLSTMIDEGEKVTSAYWIGADRKPRNVVRRTLEECLLELADEQRTKTCSGPCQTAKPLTEFSRRAKNPDGRNDRCLKCERVRVKEYEEKKRQEKVAKLARQSPPSPPAATPRLYVPTAPAPA